MARKSGRQHEALRRARQRTRERDAAFDPTPAPAPTATLDPSTPEAALRRRAATACGWCGGTIVPKTRGRIPKWCSAACRQRAWEQSRAAASGRAAVQVVERIVEIPVRPIPGVQVARQPQHREWVVLLDELARQLTDIGSVHNGELAAIERSAAAVTVALSRRRRGQ